MADDKTKVGGPDRRRVAREQPYEIGYFARKHGITQTQARNLIARIGGDRKKLNAAAQRLKRAN